MLKDITLGQYFPGDSVIHKLDPRMKIILSVIYIVSIFLSDSYVGYAAVLLSAFVLLLISKLPAGLILKGLKPLFFIILFTGIINIFWTTGDRLLFEWKFIRIYREGIEFAVYMLIRIVALVMGSSVILTYTTSPIALTDGIESVLSPLRVFRIPVHEFAMMMTIALRFIPLLIEETDKIINAQKSRGADFSNGSLMKRAKALVPILVPLFISAIYRADELAVAMECRCYHGGNGRTKLHVRKLSAKDYIALCVMCLFTGGLIALRILY